MIHSDERYCFILDRKQEKLYKEALYRDDETHKLMVQYRRLYRSFTPQKNPAGKILIADDGRRLVISDIRYNNYYYTIRELKNQETKKLVGYKVREKSTGVDLFYKYVKEVK